MIQSVLFKVILELFRSHEDFSRFRSLLRSDDLRVRQLIHDARSPVEADLEPSLQHSYGSLILLNDETSRLREQIILIGSSSGSA